MRLDACVWTLFCFVVLPIAAQEPPDNTELRQIYDADQNDREGPAAKPLDPGILPRDAARRKQVLKLMADGKLHTARDYERAAMVFQHGDTPDEILFAHVLAVTAIGKGASGARWLATATLDRYLQRIGQPQIFGTQFNFEFVDGKQNWTMEPYNRTLVPPALREANCVADLAQQTAVLEALSKGTVPDFTQPCRTPDLR